MPVPFPEIPKRSMRTEPMSQYKEDLLRHWNRQGASQTLLAERTSLSQGHISRIINGSSEKAKKEAVAAGAAKKRHLSKLERTIKEVCCDRVDKVCTDEKGRFAMRVVYGPYNSYRKILGRVKQKMGPSFKLGIFRLKALMKKFGVKRLSPIRAPAKLSERQVQQDRVRNSQLLLDELSEDDYKKIIFSDEGGFDGTDAVQTHCYGIPGSSRPSKSMMMSKAKVKIWIAFSTTWRIIKVINKKLNTRYYIKRCLSAPDVKPELKNGIFQQDNWSVHISSKKYLDKEEIRFLDGLPTALISTLRSTSLL